MNSKRLEPVFRPWGWYVTIYQSHDYWTKVLCIEPGESLSLQVHEHRAEYWLAFDFGLSAVINGAAIDLVPGVRYDVMRKALHRISNNSNKTVKLIEVATGRPDESDIARIQDKYGR